MPAGALGEKWRKGWGGQLSAATKMANSLLAYVPLIQCPDSAQQSRLLAATAIAVLSGGAACLRLAQALRHSGGTESSDGWEQLHTWLHSQMTLVDSALARCAPHAGASPAAAEAALSSVLCPAAVVAWLRAAAEVMEINPSQIGGCGACKWGCPVAPASRCLDRT